MKRLILNSVFILALLSCDDSDRSGKEVRPGVHQLLHILGEGERSPLPGDHLLLNFTLADSSDKLIEVGSVQRVLGDGGVTLLDSLVMQRVSGDSVTYRLRAEHLSSEFISRTRRQSVDESAPLLIHLGIDTVLSADEVTSEIEFYNAWLRDQRTRSEQRLTEHLLDNDIDPQEVGFAGVYVVVIKQGEGDIIAYGDQVTMNYRASFLNGEVFDDTFLGGKPLGFTCGKQGQVIWGLSLAVRKLAKGSKARIYIPYAFGFGQQGSSTGIVPPFANLIYDVEILDVVPGT